MQFFRKVALGSILAPIVLSLACLSAPAEAAATTGAKKDEKSSVQDKSKSTAKKKPTKKSSPAKNKGKKSKGSDKVLIDANDPKAFTKAILMEKKGVKYEVVGEKRPAAPKVEQKKKPIDIYLDLSTMLVPITHEALVGSPYGIRDHRLHRGVDVNVIKNEPVVASLPGRVIMSRYNAGGYGHYIIVEHENGLQTVYGHLSERLQKVDDYVYPGDIVGLAGSTGKSSAAHLHFEIRYKGNAINPENVISCETRTLLAPTITLNKNSFNKVAKPGYANNTSGRSSVGNYSKGGKYYKVRTGDTLSRIAKRNGTTIAKLCKLNNMKQNAVIRPGQTIRLR